MIEYSIRSLIDSDKFPKFTINAMAQQIVCRTAIANKSQITQQRQDSVEINRKNVRK